MKINWLISLLATILIAGCTGIGPSTIERDRFEYSSAIAESWKEMMLLNIIKIRYGDTPMYCSAGGSETAAPLAVALFSLLLIARRRRTARITVT